MTDTGPSTLYDAYYFQHGCGLPYAATGHWHEFFGQIADRVVHGIHPRTVLDAGCALGLLVAALRERGVEAYGVDISEYAIEHAPEAARPYCRVASVLDPLPQRYDLIVCMEVLEHLPPSESVRALANLCQATDDILFSSSPLDLREPTHFNVQPPEYWARLFAEQGFVRDVDFDASAIAPWALRLRRTPLALPSLAADYERKLWWLAQENYELRQASVATRAQVASLEEQRQMLVADLAAVRATLTWQLAEVVEPWRRSLLPQGSRRQRVINGWVRALLGRRGGSYD